MQDDLRPEPHHVNPASIQYFNSCISCGMSHVLKPGDYCRACAGTWRLPFTEDEYMIVTPDTIDEAIYQSDLTRSYLEAKVKKAEANDQHYVVFFAQDSWQDICIRKMYHLPTIMFHLFLALGHK